MPFERVVQSTLGLNWNFMSTEKSSQMLGQAKSGFSWIVTSKVLVWAYLYKPKRAYATLVSKQPFEHVYAG